MDAGPRTPFICTCRRLSAGVSSEGGAADVGFRVARRTRPMNGKTAGIDPGDRCGQAIPRPTCGMLPTSRSVSDRFGPLRRARRPGQRGHRYAGTAMGFLSRLLGRPQRTWLKTSVEHPLVIVNPTIGFLNLQGKPGATLAEIDRTALAPLFAVNRVSTRDPPLCNVLFIYCSFDTGGSIIGSRMTIRDMIIAAQAHVAVMACDTDQKVMARAAKKSVAGRAEWPANIVWTLGRNGGTSSVSFAGSSTRCSTGSPCSWPT